MKKAERQKVYEKYGGRCAYCGCQLEKGWHVDHLEACRRLMKWVRPGYFHKDTGERINSKIRIPEHELHEYYAWRPGKWVCVGYSNPDANHIDNYMPSCPSCNINKHGDTLEQFRKNIAGYLRSLNLRMVQYKMAKRYGLVEETGKPVVFYFESYQDHADPEASLTKN
jgi:hypothetical protein